MDKDGKSVVMIREIEFSKSDHQTIEEDKEFNKNFDIEDVRHNDLLLLSSIELDLGKTKS